MNYYSGRRQKTTAKPTILHNDNVPAKDVEWISEEIVSAYQKNADIKVNQVDLSKKLSGHF